MSETRTLLLELHCEEIPARFLKPLCDEFEDAFKLKLSEWKVCSSFTSHKEEKVLSDGTPFISQDSLSGPDGPRFDKIYSPRKIAWRVSDVAIHQPDQTETQVGPPQRMCVDEAGKPTQTGLKFAEKWNVPVSDVRYELPKGKKEPCAVVTVTKQGRPTIELLSETVPRLIAGLHVPKAMRWGWSEFEFVRPIRNILCIFGDQIVPFEVDRVKSGNVTWGHRLHHMEHGQPVKVARPEDYEAALKAAGVIVSCNERKLRMREQLDQLAAEVGGWIVLDDDLLDTLAEIVEYPRILRGEFPASFMDLPKEVLITSLKEHQKSFCIQNEKGELLPYFLCAANRPDDPEGFVKSGNEWVLRARLFDARFFFAEDRKTKLAERLDKLKHLTFHRELGSYFDKTERIEAITRELAKRLNIKIDEVVAASRSAKCDLMTLMVGEFPELQGVMGGEYLRHEGAPESVWRAVKEHYQPLSAEAPIPSTDLGCVLAVADKLDTLVGCFAIGQIPTGSKDPLALRRAGQGIVRILWEKGWNLNPVELSLVALKCLSAKATKPSPDTQEALESFFRDRVAYQLEIAGYAGSVRRSALPVGWGNLVDLKARCEALSAFAEDPRFASLGQSAKRIGNILKDETPSDSFDPERLQESAEKALATLLGRTEGTKDHKALLEVLADLADPLEAFFNAVMVKCEDPALRATRLSLLHRLRKAFLRVADFSQWQ